MIHTDTLEQLQAALNNHNITDENGDINGGDTPQTESAPIETTDIEESTTAEKPAESEVTEPNLEADDDDNHVEDEQGKRYVPEKRFKQVYAKQKELEREIEQLRKPQTTEQKPNIPYSPQAPIDKTSAIENELLFTQYPQFDPQRNEYNQNLDAVAASIYTASGGNITKLQAARKALELAKNLQAATNSIKEETKVIKRSVSENPTTRGGQRDSSVNPDSMSLEQLENYMKANKMW